MEVTNHKLRVGQIAENVQLSIPPLFEGSQLSQSIASPNSVVNIALGETLLSALTKMCWPLSFGLSYWSQEMI